MSAQPQHMQALAEANRVRKERSLLKHDIRQGKVTVAEVLDRIPWEAERMTIFELLSCQRRWGAHKTRELLAELQIGENRLLVELTERQCKQMCWYLKPWKAAA